LQRGFNFPDQAVDIGSRYRAFGTGNPNAARQFIAIKFLAGAILFDEQWSC
jgi:hypothetical protein